MSVQITLVTGDHCHLCEQAKLILNPMLEARKMSLVEINVRDDKAIFERYGLRIPVVLFANGNEKGWPFTAEQIGRMIDKNI